MEEKLKPKRNKTLLFGLGFMLSSVLLVGVAFWDSTLGNIFAMQEQSKLNSSLFSVEQSIPVTDVDEGSSNSVSLESIELNDESGIKAGVIFARIYVPRFGNDYVRVIAQGTYPSVLEHAIGHYSRTEALGVAGNFAIAGHRTTRGAPMFDIDKFKKGDRIIVEDKDNFYLYEYNNTTIVSPSFGKVLLDKPAKFAGYKNGMSILTMTSCNPKYSDKQRIVAFSVLKDVYPKNTISLEDVLGATMPVSPYLYSDN